jgi:hypothetical protein
MWRLLGFLIVLAAGAADAARLRSGTEELVQVVTPASRAVAGAHPHVNVILSFGAAKDGTPPDPATFRAKLNGRDVTRDFEPLLTNGVVTGLRAAIPQAALRLTSAPRNRLRLFVQAARGGGKRARDVDRVRFGVAEVPNQPPVAMLAAGNEVAAVGSPVLFDASGSHDPDMDALSFAWSFSDGGTASDPTVTHAFTAADVGVVGATVMVSDGVESVPASVTVPVALVPDPGRTPGVLRVEASEPLELSAVALGASATRSLTVRNTDATATSQVKIQAVLLDGAGFTVAPATLDLGPGASATIDVDFAPAAAGHASAHLMLTTSASNRAAVSFLAHGYGGTAPGDGPTLVGVPLFGAFGSDITRLAPDGARVPVDGGIGLCTLPNVPGGNDVCAVNGDCPGGEVCEAPTTPIDVGELCSDGDGLFVLSEDSFDDLRDDPDTTLAGTLVRFDLDAAGAVTGRRVLTRLTEDTTQLACDALGAAAGGLAYVAEYRTVADTESCPRDERDALVAVNKANGGTRTVNGLARMDAAAGVAECDFRDGVSELAVAPDGVAKYAGFDLHGLWRVAPTPRWFTPDVRDLFQAHPEGGVVVAVGRDRGAAGSIELYRITEHQVEHGALALSALVPCASFPVPNNTIDAAPSRTFATSIAIGPASPPATGSTALVTFHARPTTPATDVLPPFGDVRGTVAFSLPAGSAGCSVAGLVSLQAVELSR